MKIRFSRELLIGVCAVLALLILFFGINYLKGINLFHSSNYYYASFTNVTGLAESAPVTVNGFKVGLVREIEYEYDNPGHVLVELSLNKDLKVPAGTRAVLAADLLGTATISLEMPSGNLDYHNVGDKLIGVNQLGLMDNLSSDLMPNVNSLLPHIDSLVTALTAVAANPALTTSINRLDAVMANLERSTQQLAAVMDRLPAIAAGAGATMANVEGLSNRLLTISDDLAEIASKMRTAPLDSTLVHLNTVAANLDNITTAIEGDNSTIGLLIHDGSLYRNLNNSAAQLDSILVDVQRRPRYYIPPIKVF